MGEVHISIRTRIDDSTGDRQEWSHQYTGIIYQKNDQDIFLRYQESEEQSLGKTTTILKWKKNQLPVLTLIRQGETREKQIYKVGQAYRHLYQTPYGTYEMEIQPSKVSVQMENENQGSIELEYDLLIESQKAGRYQLWIQFHP